MWSSKESEASVIELKRQRYWKNISKRLLILRFTQFHFSVRFDGSRITACKAIDSLILEIEQDVKLQGKSTISKADTIILCVEYIYFETLGYFSCLFSVIESTGAGKSTGVSLRKGSMNANLKNVYTILLQLINKIRPFLKM